MQKGLNDQSIEDLVRYFHDRDIIVRFIEYMDVGNGQVWSQDDVVPMKEILRRVNNLFPVEPLEENYKGEVARRYRFLDGRGEIGFISSITQPFCRDCHRLRLSADGKLYTCLFAGEGYDLKSRLSESDTHIKDYIKQIWSARRDRYSEERSAENQTEKVPMHRIGG